MLPWPPNISLLTWAILFVVYFAYDIVCTKYILYVAKLDAFRSATSGVLLYLLTAYGTIQFVDNPWNMIPIVISSWIATYLTIKYEAKRKKERIEERKNKRNALKRLKEEQIIT